MQHTITAEGCGITTRVEKFPRDAIVPFDERRPTEVRLWSLANSQPSTALE